MLVSGTTLVYGIIGKPVDHSLSPLMHNAAFKELRMNCIYVPFCPKSASCAINAMRCLGICGFSVTAPFKESIVECLDKIDESSKEIGAVNTLRRIEEKVIGINTDWLGAVKALERRVDFKGKRCVVLGAGGTARAVVYGLKKRGARVIILNRTEDRAKELALEFKVEFGSLSDIEQLNAKILINTTPVGMHPEIEKSLVPKQCLRSFDVVMDVVYKPRMTKLLRDAKSKGCDVVEGLEMLLEQGIAQFEWWTGKVAPREAMARAIGLSGT